MTIEELKSLSQKVDEAVQQLNKAIQEANKNQIEVKIRVDDYCELNGIERCVLSAKSTIKI